MCGGVADLRLRRRRPARHLPHERGEAARAAQESTRPSTTACSATRGDGTFEDVTRERAPRGRRPRLQLRRRRRRLRQRRPRRPLPVPGRPQRALPQRRRRHLHATSTEKAGLAGKPKDLLSVCAAWVDYDGDGLLDLVVSHYTHWSPATDIRCSVPEAGEIYCTPRRYGSVAAHALPQPRRRPLRGRRASARGSPPRRTARAWASRSPTSNDDDRMDVFVANDTEPNFLFVNQGGGRFAEQAAAWGIDYNDRGETVSGMGADAKDYDNDGRVDVFYNNLQHAGLGPVPERGRPLRLRLARHGGAQPEPPLLRLEQRLRRLRQRRLEGHLLRQRRRRLPAGERRAARHDAPQPRRPRASRTSRSGSAPTSSRWATSAARPSATSNGDGFLDIVVTSLGRRAAHPGEPRRQRQPLAAGRRARPAQQPRRHRREAEADDRPRAARSTTT